MQRVAFLGNMPFWILFPRTQSRAASDFMPGVSFPLLKDQVWVLALTLHFFSENPAVANDWLVVNRDPRTQFILKVKSDRTIEGNAPDQKVVSQPGHHSGFPRLDPEQIFSNVNHMLSPCRGSHRMPPHPSFRTDAFIPMVTGNLSYYWL